jgi:signal transduction histidine kinase
MNSFSIKNKLFLFFSIIIIISVSTVAWFGYFSAKQSYEESTLSKNINNVKELSNVMSTMFEITPDDLKYHANFYALHRILIWEELQDKEKVTYWEQIYRSSLRDFIYKKKLYYQIAILDEYGNEKFVLKYNGTTKNIIEIRDDNLKNQSNEEYFKNAIKLKKDEFYISSMDLNFEGNKLEKPLVPIVRYSTPIVNQNGKTKGIVVLNFEVNEVFKKIEKAEKNNDNDEYFLIDENGTYLYNKDTNKRWSKQLNTDFNFKDDYKGILEQFKNKESAILFQDEHVFFMNRLYANEQEDKNRFWYIVNVQHKDLVFSSLLEFKNNFFILLLTVLFLGLFIINYYISKLIYPLTKVTSQLKSLSVGEIKKEDIIYNSKDEIADIVSSTRILIDAIESTIYQANSIAKGNFKQEVKLLGKNDKLGYSLQEMTSTLQNITKLSNQLSHGNYHVSNIIKNNDDELGIALKNMIEYFRNITDLSESISLGDLDVIYKIKSQDDKLGLSILEMLSYLKTILTQAKAIAKGDYSQTIIIKSENDELGLALKNMLDTLKLNAKRNEDDIYFSKGILAFNDNISNIKDFKKLSLEAITEICRYANASSGVFYIFEEKEPSGLHILSSFAMENNDSKMNVNIQLGEGQIGQVALERKPVHLKARDEKINCATGSINQKDIFIFPIISENTLLGVIEVMSLQEFTKIHIDYFIKSGEILASIIFGTKQNSKIKELLEKSQQSFEELQVQSEELQQSNVEMQEQQQQIKAKSEELKEKNKILTQAKKEISERAIALEEASRYKSEFLANMSHELRTPLNSIILLSKLMLMNKDQKLDEDDIKKSSVINKAGNDLLLLINDILDLSKIESGKMELNLLEISSSEIVDEMKGLFDDLAKEKKISFLVNDNINSSFISDKIKFSQVLKNLLSNAFKFTKEGSVSLNLSTSENKLVISVSDTGLGISKENIGIIFQAFKQVDGSITREFGGTGLGLSISKTIVELFNGHIEVESELGVGSTFKVIIPLIEKVEQQIQLPIEEKKQEEKQIDTKKVIAPITIISENEILQDGYQLKDKNVLIVDDDSRNIFTIGAFIEKLNGEVYSAFNGKEALEVLEKENIDLILMDIMMPVMDGLKAIKTIRSIDKFKQLPIIAITAKTMEKDKQDCLDAGASDYMSKPLDHDALLFMIKAWVK